MQVPPSSVAVAKPSGDLWGLVGREVVQDDVNRQPSGHGSVDLFEERQHVLGGVTLVAVSEYLPGGEVHRGEQVDGPVALVVVGHGARATGNHGQPRLGAVDRLTLSFLVEAEHHRPSRRIQAEANDVDELLGSYADGIHGFDLRDAVWKHEDLERTGWDKQT